MLCGGYNIRLSFQWPRVLVCGDLEAHVTMVSNCILVYEMNVLGSSFRIFGGIATPANGEPRVPNRID
jgi:hypothetical protein